MNKFQKLMDKQHGLEAKIFAAILVCSIPYFSVMLINGILAGVTWIATSISLFLLLVAFYSVYYGMKKSYSMRSILAFNIVVTVGFLFFWPVSSGVSGGAGYIFLSLSIFLLLTASRERSIITAGTLLIILFLISSEMIVPEGSLTYQGIVTDFIANLFIISVMILLFKSLFDKEEAQLERKIVMLTQLNADLTEKNTAVEANRKEILTIRSQLKEIIDARTLTYRERNEKIIEYTFINAHLVRAPLTNIMGLAQLPNEEKEIYEGISQHANELDQVIRKIGGILSIATEEQNEKKEAS